MESSNRCGNRAPRASGRSTTWILFRGLRGEAGLTLIELLILMAVIGVLATIAVLVYNDFTYQAQIARATADISILQGEISTYEAAHGHLPDDLAQMGRGSLLDPWGSPYQYLNFASGSGQPRKDHALHPINSDYDLYSKGRDGNSTSPLTAQASRDDIIRANDGQYIGLASKY